MPARSSLIGAGREAEIFAWEEGRAMRLLRPGLPEGLLDREAAALAAAGAAGAPVPEVFERVTVDGRPGLVMERVDGPDLLTRIGRQPWSVLAAANLLGRVHAELHAVKAPDALPALKDELRSLLASDLVPSELADPALRRLEGLAEGDRLCHGDFHPGNVLLGASGPGVIDWHGATRGDPAADVARTWLLVLIAVVPGAESAAVRLAGGLGRRGLLAGYLRSYKRSARLDERLVRSWEEVLLAARLAEGIDDEREALLRRLRSVRPGGQG